MQLQAVVLADCRAGVCGRPPVYLFAETPDNEMSVLQKGVEFGSKGHEIVIHEGEPNPGYPGGAKAWTRELQKRGVSGSLIKVTRGAGLHSTFSESLALIKAAQTYGWDTLYIVASPFHQLRAFLSVLGAMKRLEARLRVYNCVGAALPWNHVVTHSQGTLIRTRLELVAEELRRIETYTTKGDLVSVDDALAYLKCRGN